LVELLVVIGIIAVLIGILLPALSKAREQANMVKCSSNLRQIGQAVAIYESSFGSAIPPSNFYVGLQINADGSQNPPTPTSGYVHWSSLIFAPQIAQYDSRFYSTSGWEMFQCPSLTNGGIPPANTYPSNHDLGLTNEAPDGANGPVIDMQAPRLAYMLNEALTPRSIFTTGPGPGALRNAKRAYVFVKAGSVSHSAATILGTEMWGNQAVMEASSNISGSGAVSNSRRPVSGISVTATKAALGTFNLGKADSAYTLPVGDSFGWATIDDLRPDPSSYYASSSPTAAYGSPTSGGPNTTLDFVGRNHGVGKPTGNISGSTQTGWDLRKSNFLYLDGHVETKHVTETVYPLNQWGEKFYSLPPY
jgi:prepilin-type processing-associated H-X9-DG protein